MEAVRTKVEPAWQEVKSVGFQIHHGAKGESLKITYMCGMRMFNEWVAISRGGRAGHMAEHWWNYRTRFGNHEGYWPPKTAVEALRRANKGELNVPVKILVKEDGKYPRIERYIFPG